LLAKKCPEMKGTIAAIMPLHFANFLPLAESVGILTHPTKRLLMGIADGTVRDAGATPR
jgi:hypothetical protein